MWHGFSWKFHFISRHKATAVWSKSTPNSMTISCHLSRFYLFSMLEHDMDFGQVQVMEFPWHFRRKWWDFPSGFGLIFESNQTAVKKTWENIKCHIFYRDSNWFSAFKLYLYCLHALDLRFTWIRSPFASRRILEYFVPGN